MHSVLSPLLATMVRYPDAVDLIMCAARFGSLTRWPLMSNTSSPTARTFLPRPSRARFFGWNGELGEMEPTATPVIDDDDDRPPEVREDDDDLFSHRFVFFPLPGRDSVNPAGRSIAFGTVTENIRGRTAQADAVTAAISSSREEDGSSSEEEELEGPHCCDGDGRSSSCSSRSVSRRPSSSFAAHAGGSPPPAARDGVVNVLRGDDDGCDDGDSPLSWWASPTAALFVDRRRISALRRGGSDGSGEAGGWRPPGVDSGRCFCPRS
mmetsp:Transcript_2818/g.7135  ORF Transcript_2818/g.7135 Transcript_2818/m.7135 type:complete len:266 (-) Transcript_2818:84-881(-)